MDTHRPAITSKVPEITLAFRIIRIAATIPGETGGDAVSMTLHPGYLLATAVFAVLFLVLVTARIRAIRFRGRCTGRSSSPPP